MVKLSHIPNAPGVYFMKDQSFHIIYIGKAKDLKKRVLSYFQGDDFSIKTHFLVEKIAHVDFIVTNNEKEALILENSLIKKHLPYYNINLRDGKSYASLAIDYNSTFPRLYITREKHRKKVRYFGPYPSASNARALATIAEKYFLLRRCKVSIVDKEKLTPKIQPCFLYHIKKCPGACIWKDDPVDYKNRLKQFIYFLKGHFNKMQKSLEKEMNEHAEKLRFEQAARTRDLLQALDEVVNQQKIYFSSDKIIDIIGYFAEAKKHTFVILRFSHGQLSYKRHFTITHEANLQNILGSLIEKIYVNEVIEEEERLKEIEFKETQSQDSFLEEDRIHPHEIILPFKENDLVTSVENVFQEFYSENPPLIKTQQEASSTLQPLLNMAFENAQWEWKSFFKVSQGEAALMNLKNILELEDLPLRIETYDISNIGSHFACGAFVSFFNAMPDKKRYRAFKMKYTQTQNDFAMLQETLLRRFRQDDLEDPDLLVMDGGKGQVSAALEILEALKKDHIPLIGLAKKEELIILPHQKDPLALSKSNPALRLLMASRDEAHRFSNQLRKKWFLKKTLQSDLLKIKGLGSARQKKLLEEFQSWEKIKKTPLNILQNQTKIPKSVLESVIFYLNQEKN